MSLRKCECCGISYLTRDFPQVSGIVRDIEEFCLTCRDNRCDAFPCTCPNKKEQK